MQILPPEIAAATAVAALSAGSVDAVTPAPAPAVDTNQAAAGPAPVESDKRCPDERAGSSPTKTAPALPLYLLRFAQAQIACTINEFLRLSGEKRNHFYDLVNTGEIVTFLSGSRRMVLLPTYLEFIGRQIEAERQGRIRSVQANNIDRKDLRAG
jgi:hypothetical protein